MKVKIKYITPIGVKSLSVFSIFFFFLNCNINAQELISVRKKKGKYGKIEYHVLKSNKQIKHGLYHYSVLRYNDRLETVTKGEYFYGHKIGHWLYNQNTTKPSEEFYSDSGILKWNLQIVDGIRSKNYLDKEGRITKTLINNKSITLIDDTMSLVEIEVSNYSLKGILINDEKNGRWRYTYSPKFSGILSYKNDQLDGLSFSLNSSGDTLSKMFYSDSIFQWQIVFNKSGDTLYYTYLRKDGVAEFYHYFDNGNLHQFAEVTNGKILTLTTLDPKGDSLSKGTIKNGTGIYALYYINADTFELNESCPVSYGNYDGFYTFHRTNKSWNTKYQQGYPIIKGGKLSSKKSKIKVQDLYGKFNTDAEGGLLKLEENLMSKVIQTFIMPLAAMELGISGVIMLQFTIEHDGNLSNVHSILPKERQLGYGLEEECIRIVRLTNGTWHPTFQFGLPVLTIFRFPFEIDNNSGF